MKKAIKILVAALLCQGSFAATARAVEVGGRVPDFSVTTFQGQTVSRASLAGKPALVVFWNTWCSLCRKELPQVNKVAAQYGPRGLTVLAVNSGLNDSEAKARAYWAKSAFGFGSGFDHRYEMGEAFGLRGVPMVVLVDPAGVVRYQGVELPDEARLQQMFKGSEK